MSDDNLQELLRHLAGAAKEISRGDYRAAEGIFEFTKSGKYPAGITELAEAFGMMLVMVETREERLERLIEDLTEKKHMLEDTAHALREANIGVLEVLGNAIAKRDHETSAHNYRVTLYAVTIARAMGRPGEDLRGLIKGSFLHDVGKIGISDTILLKKGGLTAAEFETMKRHVEYGSDIIGGYPWLADCVDIILHHHEKFDGTGYMSGLKGREIPVNARIFAVADVFDALSSARPYKPALPYDEVMAIMEKERGTHFDPEMFDALRGIGDTLYRQVFLADEDHMSSTLKGYIHDLFGETDNR